MGDRRVGSVNASLMLATPAFAHGDVDEPKSRALMRKEGVNRNCGSKCTNTTSLNSSKASQSRVPLTGELFPQMAVRWNLDRQTRARWTKTNIGTVLLSVDWTYVTPRAVSRWTYYLTTRDWNPNSPLTCGELERISVVRHDGTAALTNTHHVILAVWDVTDTANAFYKVMDVNIHGSAEQIVAPDATKNS